MIGIRLADHSVYPILAHDTPARKRVVLTTARDDQDRMVIELIRSSDQEAGERVHITIGRIDLSDLNSGPKGRPSVTLTLSLDENDNLSATATDRDTGNTESIRVSIDRPAVDAAMGGDFSEPAREDGAVTVDETAYEKPPRRLSPLVVASVVVAVIAVLGLLAWLFLRGPQTEVAPPATDEPVGEAPTETPEETAEAEPGDEQPPEDEAQTAQPTAATQEEPSTGDERGIDPTLSRESIEYKIERGDTLWDISESFYGTPWLYPEIAERNNINNPDRIFASDDIRIPERER